VLDDSEPGGRNGERHNLSVRWRRADRTAGGTATRGRGFVIATLASCFGLLAAVFALNIVVDPFAIAGTGVTPTAVENDRSIKLTLIEKLRSSPEILVLGSSRARQAEPAFLRELTGHSGFNAGVTGGTAADAWVFTRFAAARFPHAKRRYIWFVDVGIAAQGINPQLAADPRAAKYLENGPRRFGLKDVATYLGPDATRASIHVLRACVVKDCVARVRYLPDGSIPRSQLRYLPEQEGNLKAAAAALAAGIRANPSTSASDNPARYTFFERTLAFMNSRGERPVIVFNPIYPTVLAEFERIGFSALANSLAYLRNLRRRGFDFVVVNCQDIRTWDGRPEDFANPTHVNWKNMRRMLRYIVTHSGGALS
jgi:hypothetical protein